MRNSSYEVIPAILEQSFSEIEKKFQAVSTFTQWVQIDICDGLFVPSYTWPYEDHAGDDDDGSASGDIDDLGKLAEGPSIELDLYVNNPEEVLSEWLVRSEVRRIVLHPRSTLKIRENLEAIRKAGKETALALELDTPAELLEPLMPLVDRVQVMGIRAIGIQGEPFDPEAVIKVRKLREQYPSVTLAVDGGVSLEHANALLEAGADALVVGSALFRSDDLANTYASFVHAQPPRGEN